ERRERGRGQRAVGGRGIAVGEAGGDAGSVALAGGGGGGGGRLGGGGGGGGRGGGRAPAAAGPPGWGRRRRARGGPPAGDDRPAAAGADRKHDQHDQGRRPAAAHVVQRTHGDRPDGRERVAQRLRHPRQRRRVVRIARAQHEQREHEREAGPEAGAEQHRPQPR